VLELTPEQVALLERLAAQGFQVVSYPLYAHTVGVRKGNCAALLGPAETGGLRVFGEPSFLVEGNLAVRVARAGRQWFVWKKKQVEATPERMGELEHFVKKLARALGTVTED
jgi:hypothetical protein